MQAIISWLMKLVGGWLPIGTKPFPEWLGKVLWAVGIFIACQLIMAFFFPNKNVINVGSGGIVQQAEPRDMMGFGCNISRLYVKTGVKSK